MFVPLGIGYGNVSRPKGYLMARITADEGVVADVDLNYEDSASGRPVVLIHGWPLSLESWKGNVPALTDAGYRVVAYDRRGFGNSDKPLTGYGYDQLADDLESLMARLDLREVTLVGFSMGGGEVARYVTRHGEDRLRSVVFASAVPPYMLQTDDNPQGPLTKKQAAQMTTDLTADQESFYDEFTTNFFSVNGELVVSEADRQEALAMALQSSKAAALECMTSFGMTDFRDDLPNITVPVLVIHGDGDATVPFEGSGQRTHETLKQSELHVVAGGPHGINVSHADEFNRALLDFLQDSER